MPTISLPSTPEQPRFSDIIRSFGPWPRLIHLLWQNHRELFVTVLLLNIALGVLPGISILLTQYLVNFSETAWSVGIAAFRDVVLLLALIIAVAIITQVLARLQQFYQSLLQESLSQTLNIQLIDKALTFELRHLEQADIYDKLQRARDEASSRPYQALQQMIAMIRAGMSLISVAGVLLVWKWWVALILICAPIPSLLFLFRHGWHMYSIEQGRTPIRRMLWYLDHLLTTDLYFKEIKTYGLGPALRNRMAEHYRMFFQQDRELLRKQSRLSILYDSIGVVILGVSQALMIWQLLLHQISVGQLVAYLQAAMTTQSQAESLMFSLFSIYTTNLYLGQLFEFMDIDTTPTEHRDGDLPLSSIEVLEFQNVSFCYPGSSQEVLHDISFTCRRGDVIGIVGENGSGKSTLVKLLCRLYTPTSGQILINGHPIERYRSADLRKLLGVLFQDFVQYQMTVKENIGFGYLEECGNTALIEAASLISGADEVIRRLPKGLDSQLGKWFEEGSQLSGGEWQKIAIARAFMNKRDLYILDEPSFALDARSEAMLFKRVQEASRDAITLYITHRLASLRMANQILVMQNGSIVERGTHEMLMQKQGLYFEMYRAQNPHLYSIVSQN